MTQPTLGRQVSALESELGVALFERGGRGLELTPSGVELLEHVRAMGNAASQFSLSATGQSKTLEGSISISATEVVAAFELPGMLAKLRQLEPGIDIEVIASNTSSDLKRREADIAVRSFRPTQPDLIARKVHTYSFYLYAASEYLERIGRPEGPQDLSQAEFLGIDRTNALIAALGNFGITLSQDNFPVITENLLVLWEMVKSGLGIGFMSDNIGELEPRVEKALPSMPPLPVEIWLVAHRELKTSRRIRTVFDFLAGEFSTQ